MVLKELTFLILTIREPFIKYLPGILIPRQIIPNQKAIGFF